MIKKASPGWRPIEEIKQQELTSIVEHAVGEMRDACRRYMEKNRAHYLDAAMGLIYDRRDWTHVWDRFAFAILTANAETDNAHKALHLVRKSRGHYPIERTPPGIVPERIKYVNSIPLGDSILALLRKKGETWHAYRLRLDRTVAGLALTKASYAACLLYPLDADVACIDVWMQRILFGVKADFRSLSLDEYCAAESQVRAEAKRVKVATCLAQWMMWDFIRTGEPSDQRFFTYPNER